MQILEHSSTTQTTGASSVKSIESTNSVQKNAATATTANVINDVEQLRLQQQLALANSQMLYYQYYQYICRQFNQINGAGGAAASSWPCALPVGDTNLPWLILPNGFQLQGLPGPGFQGIQDQRSQAQKIISNAERLQNHVLNPNLLAAGAVSTTNHQHILPLRPSQSVHAGAQTNTHQIQQYPKYSKKRHVVATATNPATVSSHDQHSRVTEYGIPNPAIVATSTATSTESLSSNSDLDNPPKKRRDAGNRSNCKDPDKSESKKKLHICPVPGCTIKFSRNSELQAHIRSHTSLPFNNTSNHFGELKRHLTSHAAQKLQLYPNDSNKGEVVASATNPDTESTPNQHSQVTEFDNTSSAIATTSTTATSTKSQSSNSELNDSNKEEVVTTATNPETESTLNQHSQVIEFDNHSSAIDTTYTTATSTKSQSPNSELNDSNKEEVVTTATNPETESTPIQHSQVTEFDNPGSAIATTSTTATSTKSQSSNSELNAPGRRRRCTCAICISSVKRKRESKERLYLCHFPGCLLMFSSPSNLRTHILKHIGEKPFCCKSCGKTLISSDDLDRHQQIIHTDEYVFQCTECIKRFSRIYDLSEHLKTHRSKSTLKLPAS